MCPPGGTCGPWSPEHFHTRAASCACVHALSLMRPCPVIDAQMHLHTPSASHCQARMGLILTSQLLLLPAAGFLGGSVSLTEVFAAAGANMTFDACVQDCKADSSCQYITYRYQTTKCFKKVAGTGRSVRRGCRLCCMCPAGRSVPAVTSCDCCCCRGILPPSVPDLPL